MNTSKKSFIIAGSIISTILVSNSAYASTYKVQSGDNLSNIAKAKNTTIKIIKSQNNLTSNTIFPGQVLKINSTTAKSTTTTTTKKHVVKLGDTLSNIAKKYDLSLSALLKLNPSISNANRISIGQSIVVSGQSTSTASKSTTNSTSSTYKVVSGDNLSKIAKVHNTTVKALLSLNPSIKNANSLKIGQSIKLSGKATTTTTATVTTAISEADQVLKTAEKYLGAKYLYGASTSRTDAFDCSSFTLQAFKAVGVKLPRSSVAQSQVGVTVSSYSLKKGDLVFFDTNKDGVINHVGIYAGNNQMINASNSKGVSYANINSSYWKPLFVKAVRILN